MVRVWVLGSMGWMPAAGQETACVLLECGSELIMCDAGTGVANLGLVEDVLAAHDHLSVLLSHYHLDHVIGLMYLSRFVRDKRVDVYGPGRPVYPRSTEAYLSDLLQGALYGAGPTGFARTVRFHDYGGADFLVGDVRIGVCAQRHSSPSFLLRVGDVVTYATDTCFMGGLWETLRPTPVLLHECWQLTAVDGRHTSAEDLANPVFGSFARKLVIHQNPAWSEKERAEVAAVAGRGGFSLARDGMCLSL